MKQVLQVSTSLGVRSSDEMRRGSEILDPYCRFCGRYKGVGPCQYPDCPGFNTSNEEQRERIPLEQERGHEESAGKLETCCICNEPKSVFCSVCGRIYCSRHSSGRLKVTVIGPDHHIGTCINCGRLVCEHCWILDNLGKITCIKHLEERNVHDSPG
jgi:hypothetical protein